MGYTENSKSVSTSILTGDSTQFADDGTGNVGPKTALIKASCPNACSGNGNCSDTGTCTCQTNYRGTDCSINLSSAPLFYKTIYDNDRYDLSNGSLSDVILIMDKFVSDSENAVVKVTVLVSSWTLKSNQNSKIILKWFSNRWFDIFEKIIPGKLIF